MHRCPVDAHLEAKCKNQGERDRLQDDLLLYLRVGGVASIVGAGMVEAVKVQPLKVSGVVVRDV